MERPALQWLLDDIAANLIDVVVSRAIELAENAVPDKDRVADGMAIPESKKLLDEMRSLPEVVDVTTDLLASAPQLKITINRDQASRFGISVQTIDETLNDAFGQRQVAQYYTQLDTYWVILEIPPELQTSLASLERIYVKSPLTGAAVPLSALVDTDSNRIGPLCCDVFWRHSRRRAGGVVIGPSSPLIRSVGRPPMWRTASAANLVTPGNQSHHGAFSFAWKESKPGDGEWCTLSAPSTSMG